MGRSVELSLKIPVFHSWITKTTTGRKRHYSIFQIMWLVWLVWLLLFKTNRFFVATWMRAVATVATLGVRAAILARVTLVMQLSRSRPEFRIKKT